MTDDTTEYAPVPEEPMPGAGGRAPRHPPVDARRVWAGGAATAVVCGLLALVALQVADIALNITPVAPGWVVGGGSGWSLSTRFAVTGVLAALVATGLLHLLLFAAPRPLVFFGWIVTLATVAAGVAPFSANATLSEQAVAAAIAAGMGLVIGSALTAVAGRPAR